MCFIDMDPVDRWSETKRVSSGRARCASCKARIPAGVEYVRHWSLYEGTMTNNSVCSACIADRATFASDHEGMYPCPEDFPRMLQDCIAEGDEASETKWRPMLSRLRARGADVGATR